MKIQNIMEDYVTDKVNTMYDELPDNSFVTCKCPRCRSDVICYVLNRIPPKYVVSSKGGTFVSLSIDNQTKIDVDALIIDGMKLVNTSKRHYGEELTEEKASQPYFIFPVFVGSVLDGNSFEPIMGAVATLTAGGQIIEMEDGSWINPCETYNKDLGVFSFKPKPIPADATGIEKDFSFTVTISAEKYQTLSYSFNVSVTSTTDRGRYESLKLQNSHLFLEDDNEDDDLL